MFGSGHLRFLLLLIALSLASAMGWALFQGDPRLVGESGAPMFRRAIAPSPGEAISAERDRLKASVDATPELAGFVGRAAKAFPADWNRQADAFVLRAASAHELEKPEAVVADLLRVLRRDRGVVAAKADDAALARVFDAQSTLTGKLANIDKRLCADFILGQTSPAFYDALRSARPAFAELASATLAAIVEGAKAEVERGAPNDGDFSALEAELRRRGLGDTDIAVLLDGKMPDPPMEDGVLCDAGLVYYDAAKSIPTDARMRLYALAMSASSGR